MPPQKQPKHVGLGEGAHIEMTLSLVRPKTSINDTFPNPVKGQRFGGVVTKRDNGLINKKFVRCVFFSNSEYPGEEFYAAYEAPFAMVKSAPADKIWAGHKRIDTTAPPPTLPNPDIQVGSDDGSGSEEDEFHEAYEELGQPPETNLGDDPVFSEQGFIQRYVCSRSAAGQLDYI